MACVKDTCHLLDGNQPVGQGRSTRLFSSSYTLVIICTLGTVSTASSESTPSSPSFDWNRISVERMGFCRIFRSRKPAGELGRYLQPPGNGFSTTKNSKWPDPGNTQHLHKTNQHNPKFFQAVPSEGYITIIVSRFLYW